jgi:hypothetical protein
MRSAGARRARRRPAGARARAGGGGAAAGAPGRRTAARAAARAHAQSWADGGPAGAAAHVSVRSALIPIPRPLKPSYLLRCVVIGPRCPQSSAPPASEVAATPSDGVPEALEPRGRAARGAWGGSKPRGAQRRSGAAGHRCCRPAPQRDARSRLLPQTERAPPASRALQGATASKWHTKPLTTCPGRLASGRVPMPPPLAHPSASPWHAARAAHSRASRRQGGGAQPRLLPARLSARPVACARGAGGGGGPPQPQTSRGWQLARRAHWARWRAPGHLPCALPHPAWAVHAPIACRGR